MKKILVTLLTLAMLAVPAAAFAGTSFHIGASSYNGNGGISVGFSSHSPSYHSHRSRTVVIRGGGHYHRPAYPRTRVVVRHNYPRYSPPHHGAHPYGYVHRQEGRVYEEHTYSSRRVYVVPSGSRRVVYHPY